MRLPPPAAPPFAAPTVAVPPAPPAPGTGRLFVDVTNASARVYALSPAFVAGRAMTPTHRDDELLSTSDGYFHAHGLCATPCAIDLPVGARRLLIARANLDDAEQVIAPIGAAPLVLRRTMGAPTRLFEPTGVAGAVLLSVAAALAFGFVVAVTSEDRATGQAAIPLLVSAALTGGLGLVVGLGTREAQAGTSSWWTLDGTAIR